MLDAVGIESQIDLVADRYHLRVASDRADAAREQLRRYEAENRIVELPPAPLFVLPNAGLGSGIYAAVLIIVSYLAGNYTFGLDWTRRGALTGTMVHSHEWWRVITSLTLHADLAHLLGNLLIGGLFGFFAGQLFGPGLAWLSILCAGALGGVVNGLLMPETQLTIGASGAVFATLGMIAAYTWRQRSSPRLRWVQRTVPLLAAAGVLAMLGTGGENTDVLAHLTGFVCGVLLGALYGRMNRRSLDDVRLQLATGFIALSSVFLAWIAALS